MLTLSACCKQSLRMACIDSRWVHLSWLCLASGHGQPRGAKQFERLLLGLLGRCLWAGPWLGILVSCLWAGAGPWLGTLVNCLWAGAPPCPSQALPPAHLKQQCGLLSSLGVADRDG